MGVFAQFPFLVPLREAFDQSANFITWSTLTMITAYVGLVIFQLPQSKSKFNVPVSIVLFSLSTLISLVNLFFMSVVFQKKMGNIIGITSFVVGFIVVFINAAPVLLSLASLAKKANKE